MSVGVRRVPPFLGLNMLDSEKMLELANMFDRTKRMMRMLTGDNLLHLQISDGKQEAVLNIQVEDNPAGADFMGNLATALEQFSNSIAHRIQDEVRTAHID